MPTPHVLAEVRRATDRHGVIRGTNLRLTRDQVEGLIRARVISKQHRNVYRNLSVPRTRLQDLTIAVAAGGWMAAAWARSSGALWRLVDEHPLTPEIVIPNLRSTRFVGANIHRSLDLCDEHLSMKDGIRCVNPLVTAVDLGVVLGPMEVASALARARQMKLFELDAFLSTLERLAKSGRTGITVAREGYDLVMIGDRPADSELELRFHHGPGVGLPPYEYQHKVVIDGRTYYIDFAYPEVMLAIEVDGYDSRKSPESLDYSDNRQNDLTLDDWVILRFTWKMVKNDPAGVQRAILRKLAGLGYRFAA